MREVLHDAAAWPVVSIDGDGQFKTSLERVRKHLREIEGAARFWSARPTIRARSARRARSRKPAARDCCAIVGQNAEPRRARRAARAAHAR